MKTLFPKIKRPYFVLCPPYTHISSGVRTLHLLVHALNSVGQRAYLALQSQAEMNVNPELLTPPLLQEIKSHYGDDFVAVYPDVARGNPLGARYVVRYLLAPAGKYGGDANFPSTDNIWGNLPSTAKKILPLPPSDASIFYSGNEERKGSCFYAHKYDRIHGQPLLPVTDGMTRLEGSLEEVAAILRKSEMCYLYEPTSILTEAALCGCPITLIRTPYFNTLDSTGMIGNCKWDDGEVVKECPNFMAEYKKAIDDFWVHLDEFINDTQNMEGAY